MTEECITGIPCDVCKGDFAIEIKLIDGKEVYLCAECLKDD